MPPNEQNTERLAPDNAGITRAAELLRGGDLVAFPTETVYGLGADARNDRAVAMIFEAKGRPRFNPLIVHVADLSAAQKIATFPTMASRLAQAFWPGPLTLVLPLRPGAGLSPLVSAGLETVALRVPEHPLAHDLLTAVAGPVAAPSANPSGKLSPTSAEHVMEGLGGRIAGVLDGGRCKVGLESTIVGFGDEPVLLRPGGLPVEILEKCLGRALLRPHPDDDQTAPVAPGQLRSHYAPAAQLRLAATHRRAGEMLLGFGNVDCDLNLSPTADLLEAAANLFRHLHELDQAGTRNIAVSPIPDHGLGTAINDRLQRAAAPRPETHEMGSRAPGAGR